MNEFEEAYRNGITKAAARLGIADARNILARAEAESIVDTSLEKQQLFSKAGATIFARAGMDNTPEYHVLCKCASSDILLPAEVTDAFIQPVERVLEKSAGIPGLPTILAWGADKTATLGAIATLLGVAGGGTYYAARRSMNESDAETEAKIEQARIYRETAKKLQKEMRKKQQEKALAPDKSFVY